ncbi:glycine oxidase [Mesorhizobium sp. Root554]|uniref:glycine oxidase ThiO n=1 Tax=unclassified Mesorhizobium TaxID=325217 RepID=UPI0006FC2DF1|nr:MULTISPECIES: glycine oxidase ThiO [unclassified Mesorhizobium]KQZ15257.1 glycine oxidase [Mesorhizobium sp. Root1471]KQZ37766.1 glycine oxidase [Mesorhizobium sp. Root554]
MNVLIKGAGVAGLTLAHELVSRGMSVTVRETRETIAGNASWQAGGMLAPWCERASAEPPVLELGRAAADWWDAALPGHVRRNGTLVVTQRRDMAELERFSGRTTGHVPVDATEIETLEPDLAGRFPRGLFFAGEAHLDPRRALLALAAKLAGDGVPFVFGDDARAGLLPGAGADVQADCTGTASGHAELRSVRGEMLILRTPELRLSRPVRLLHPRFPLYIVPREDHHFMVGATMIESSATGPITARSTMELLNAAYALHPAFGEAEIVETGVGLRPAFPDNLPRVEWTGGVLSINGLYRHGFLLAPAMAQKAADLLEGQKERRRSA